MILTEIHSNQLTNFSKYIKLVLFELLCEKTVRHKEPKEVFSVVSLTNVKISQLTF